MAGRKTFQRSEVLAKARQRLGLEVLPGSQDRAGLLALTELLYPELDIKDPRYVAWQYEQNPSGLAYELVGRVGQKVVGQYTVIPARYQIGGKPMQGSLSVNTMTHPDYRGQGLFMLLAEDVYKACQTNDAKLTLGFPNQNSYKGFLKHLDFKDIGSLPLWVLPLNLAALARSEKLKAFAPFLKLAAPLWRIGLTTFGFGRPPRFVIQKANTITEDFNELWETVKWGYKNLVVRDRDYLAWRFINHPTRQYTVSTAFIDKSLQGYIVTRKTLVQGIECGMIVDLLVAPTPAGAKAAQHLIRAVTRDFQKEGLALGGCLAPRNSVTATALKQCGYLRCPERFLPQPFPVIVRWNMPDAPPPGIFDLKQWYLTMGDYDAI